MKTILTFIFLSIFLMGNSQTLLPSIGQVTQPEDSDPICSYPVTIDNSSFCDPGPEVGDTMPDFTLYDMADNAFTLSNNLFPGKYTLLVSGSYTCPVFRNKISSINTVVNNYSNLVNTYVVYQMEAHPQDVASLYFGTVNITQDNIDEGILYDQPTTYGERKAMISVMNANTQILAPILIDGPCNEYLDYFGPAPQNAYLVDSNGIIVLKHCWFDKYPVSMQNDLDSILSGIISNPNGTNGTFTFTLDNGTNNVTGNPGQVLTLGGVFSNTDLVDDVIINITRENNNMPDQSWTSSMCINACLGENISTYTLQIPPNSTQHFTCYFFTGSEASGNVQFSFVNANNSGNAVNQDFYGSTEEVGLQYLEGQFMVNVFPNPTSEILTIDLGELYESSLVTLTDLSGKIIQFNSFHTKEQIEMELNESAGVYLLHIETEAGKSVIRIVKE